MKRHISYNRKGNIERAKKHEKLITSNFKKQISDSIKHTITFNKASDAITTFSKADDYNSFKPCKIIKPVKPSVLVWSMSTEEAAIKTFKKSPKDKIAVLNFASFTNPGGGWLNGSMAQEEAICGASTLYPVISSQTTFYLYNKKHTNSSLYLDRALYSPDILWFREGGTLPQGKTDVITCAAPYRKHVKNKHEADNTLKKRCVFIKEIAEQQKVDTLILGAWGAGAFGFDANFVAHAWQDAFSAPTSIKNIIYAVIPDKRSKSALNAFKNTFKD